MGRISFQEFLKFKFLIYLEFSFIYLLTQHVPKSNSLSLPEIYCCLAFMVLSLLQSPRCEIVSSSSSLSPPASPYMITTIVGNQWSNLYPLYYNFQPLSTIAPIRTWIPPTKTAHLSYPKPVHAYFQTLVHVFPLSAYSSLPHPISPCWNSSHISRPELSVTSMKLSISRNKRIFPDCEISQHLFSYYLFSFWPLQT